MKIPNGSSTKDNSNLRRSEGLTGSKHRLNKHPSKDLTLDDIAEESLSRKSDSHPPAESSLGSYRGGPAIEDTNKVLDFLLELRTEVKHDMENLSNKLVVLDQRVLDLLHKSVVQSMNNIIPPTPTVLDNPPQTMYAASVSNSEPALRQQRSDQSLTSGRRNQQAPAYSTPLPNVPYQPTWPQNDNNPATGEYQKIYKK